MKYLHLSLKDHVYVTAPSFAFPCTEWLEGKVWKIYSNIDEKKKLNFDDGNQTPAEHLLQHYTLSPTELSSVAADQDT